MHTHSSLIPVHRRRPIAGLAPVLSVLAALACAVIRLGPTTSPSLGTSTALPPSPTQPPSTHPPAVARDPNDLTTAVGLLNELITTGQPDRITELIGAKGVRFARFAVGAEYFGENNGAAIADLLRLSIEGHSPACLGYNPSFGVAPSKAIVVFDDIAIDWKAAGPDTPGVTVVGFQLFHLTGGWQLIYITPLGSDWELESVEPLHACP
jgi:hypothetical protein